VLFIVTFGALVTLCAILKCDVHLLCYIILGCDGYLVWVRDLFKIRSFTVFLDILV
jgi:hypothetical protein